MHIMKRGLVALAALTMIGTTTGLLVSSTASAGTTKGPETITSTQYSIGNGNGVGPWNGRGAINTGGVITDINNATTGDLHTLVDPLGQFTVKTTGGTQGPFYMNPVTCAVSFSITGVEADIVSGTGPFARTGIYVNATGTFLANVKVKGYVQKFPTGCDQNQNDPVAFSSSSVVAKGYIDLH
jgi:hypothetical protein